MSETATVETLTAEVRVLMVGNRQITLSVAKQLDVVSLEDLKVFGRIKLGREYEWLIGSDADGRLALAMYDLAVLRRPAYVDSEDLDGGQVTVCSGKRVSPTVGVELAFHGRRIALDERSVNRCGLPKHEYYAQEDNRCTTWATNGLERGITKAIARHDELVVLVKMARQAPLIVLAGLR